MVALSSNLIFGEVVDWSQEILSYEGSRGAEFLEEPIAAEQQAGLLPELHLGIPASRGGSSR